VRAVGQLAAALISLLVATGAIVAGEGDRVPYKLAVVVEWGDPVGSDEVRSRIERELLLEIQRRECFQAVLPGWRETADEPDLVLKARIEDYLEEELHDQSLAERYDPQAPPEQQKLYTIRIRADVYASVRAAESLVVLRDKHFVQSNAWRPVIQEDPRFEAQSEMVRQAVRTLRSFACKGSAKKWEQSLAASGAPGDEP